MGHGRCRRAREAPGQRYARARSELVEPAPAGDGKELVIGGGADRPPEPGFEGGHRLATGSKGTQYGTWLELPGVRVQGQDVEVALAHQLVDAPVGALVRQEYLCLPGEASTFS